MPSVSMTYVLIPVLDNVCLLMFNVARRACYLWLNTGIGEVIGSGDAVV